MKVGGSLSKQSVINSYGEIDEENRLQSTYARKVEFLSTIEALLPYMQKGVKVLDCGCGVGIYSLYYARQGIDVTSLDLVPKHIQRLDEIACNEEIDIKTVIGNAIDLSVFLDRSFDITFCMGPLYHLVHKEDLEACIKECVRVTKDNGIIVFSYISPFSVFPCVVRGDTEKLNKELAKKIIADKKISSEDQLCFWTDNNYYSPTDIENVLSMYELTVVDHLATDGQSIAFQNVINSFNQEQFAIWMEYHRMVCREKSILGASNHGLVITRKKG